MFLLDLTLPRPQQNLALDEALLEQAGVTPAMAKKANFVKGKGCSNCAKTGYRGRLGIFELMLMSAKVRELSFQGAPTQEIRRAAISGGMHTLYQDGIEKVLSGVTTFEEVMSEAKRTEQDY